MRRLGRGVFYIIAIAAILFILPMATAPQATAQSWWNSNWAYRRPITITARESGMPKNYQIKIFVPYNSDMQSDFEDLRFALLDDTILPYWIENYNLSENATVWVCLPFSLGANVSRNIYMYYGNPSATSQSNITNTFIRVIDGVVGSWHLDEGSGTTAYDSSDQGNDGTLNGYLQWIDGKYGKALSFDGKDDRVVIPNSAGLNITSSFTISGWLNLPTIPSVGRDFIVKNPDMIPPTPNKPQYSLYITSGGKIEFWFRTSTTTHSLIGNTTLNISTWNHFAAIFNDAEDVMRIYLNGSIDGKKTDVNKNPVSSTGNLYFGWGYCDRYTNCVIDEIRIYNRALSAEEISDLYNNYGYTTTNYPGRVLVRKYVSPEPTASIEAAEEQISTFIEIRYEDDGSLVPTDEMADYKIVFYFMDGTETEYGIFDTSEVNKYNVSRAKLKFGDGCHRTVKPNAEWKLIFYVDVPADLEEYSIAITDFTGRYAAIDMMIKRAEKIIHYAPATVGSAGINKIWLARNESYHIGLINHTGEIYTKTITIVPPYYTSIEIYDVEKVWHPQVDITWGAEWVNSTTIRISYNDSSAQTTSASIKIYEVVGLFDKELKWEETITEQSHTEEWGEANENNKYKVVLSVDHAKYGTFSESKILDPLAPIFTMPPITMIASIIVICIMGLIFGPAHAHIAPIVMCLTALFFVHGLGWLPIGVSPIAIGMLVLAIIWMLVRGGGY